MSNGEFATWLRVTMRDREIKPSELAKLTGNSPAAVTNWTKGKQPPKPDNLRRVAEVLGVPDRDFLRLTVLAGWMSEKEAGVPPLEIPDGRAKLLDTLEQAIPNVTTKTLAKMLAAAEELEHGS